MHWLAARLGKTIDEIGKISSSELTDWMAYKQLEDDERYKMLDMAQANICTTLANLQLAKASFAYKRTDFMLFPPVPDKKDMSMSLKSALKAAIQDKSKPA